MRDLLTALITFTVYAAIIGGILCITFVILRACWHLIRGVTPRNTGMAAGTVTKHITNVWQDFVQGFRDGNKP